jgi:seryl-tRNA synthetase
LNTRRNVLSEQVGEAIKSGNKTKAEEIKEQVKQIKNEVETLEDTQREVYAKLREVLFSIPNIPDESVPVGKDENDNVELRKFGKAPNFDFSPLPH